MENVIRNVERTAGFFLLAIAVLTFLSVAGRYLFSVQVPDAFDFTKLIQGIAIFWGIACATWRNDHIVVDLLWEHVSPANQRRIDIAATVVLLLFIAGIVFMLGSRVWPDLANSSQSTSDLRLRIAPFHALAWLGMLAALFLGCVRLKRLILPTRTPQATEPVDGS